MSLESTKRVKTLTEFIALVEKIYAEWGSLRTTTHPWFRGQTNARWRLIPGLYRGWIDSYYERELVRDFRLHSHLLLNNTPTNYLEWLFLMQHYGMPTRLLDWTESYLSALYFAVANRNSTVNGAVWVLDPWSLNDNAIEMQSVPVPDHDRLKPYIIAGGIDGLGRDIKAKVPVAVRPPRANPRINAQRGSFTIHGSLKSGLDTILKNVNKHKPDLKIRLHKIIIDGASKGKLRKELYLAGVTEAVLFPDLVGLSGEISYRYSKEYMSETKIARTKLKKLLLHGAPGRGSSRSMFRTISSTKPNLIRNRSSKKRSKR